eukprot:11883080-Ditylum_brightwellii.AAC.1
MLLQDKLGQAVRWITGQDKGGLLQPMYVGSKTGKPVSEVILSKHPAPSQPPKSALKEYDTLPALIEIDMNKNVVQSMAAKMQGVASPGDMDSIAWQDWFLCFGKANCKPCKLVALVAHWFANTCPAWHVPCWGWRNPPLHA